MRCARSKLTFSDRLEGHSHTSDNFGVVESEVGGPESDILGHGGHEQLIVGVLEHESNKTSNLTKDFVPQCQVSNPDRPRLGS